MRHPTPSSTRTGFLLALAAILLAAPAASARSSGDEQDDPGRLGTYLGVALAGGIESFDDVAGLDVDSSLGFQAWIGQRLHRHVSVEAQWEWMDGFEIDTPGGDLEFEQHQLTANARFYLLTGRIQPYLKAGVGFVHTEIDTPFGSAGDDDTGVGRAGAGLELYASREFTVNVSGEFVIPTDDVVGVDTRYVSVAAGFQYRF